MKKLKLNLNDLKVESFEITSSASQKGTVVGHDLYTQIEACPASQPCSHYGPTCNAPTCPLDGCLSKGCSPTAIGLTCGYCYTADCNITDLYCDV